MPRFELIERRIKVEGSPESLRELLATLARRTPPIDKEEASGIRDSIPPGPGPRSCRALAHRPCDTLAKRSA
jgi:hypothetical protein